MKKTGTIMIIEDDMDDQVLLEETFSILDYPNPVIFFSNGNDALDYLEKNTPPVLIISDVNMPKISGIEVREKINSNKELQKLQIPFVFFTTAQKEAVAGACSCSFSDNGFFTKPNSMAEIQDTIKTIVEYWVGRYIPNLFFKQEPQKLRY